MSQMDQTSLFQRVTHLPASLDPWIRVFMFSSLLQKIRNLGVPSFMSEIVYCDS